MTGASLIVPKKGEQDARKVTYWMQLEVDDLAQWIRDNPSNKSKHETGYVIGRFTVDRGSITVRRNRDSLIGRNYLSLDIEKPEIPGPEMDELVDALVDELDAPCILHKTWSHGLEGKGHRYHLLVELSREVTRDEYRRIVPVVMNTSSRDIFGHGESTNAVSVMFTPPSQHAVDEYVDGVPLDVDALLAQAEPERVKTSERVDGGNPILARREIDRLLNKLETLDERVAHGMNPATVTVVTRICSLTLGNGLDWDGVVRPEILSRCPEEMRSRDEGEIERICDSALSAIQASGPDVLVHGFEDVELDDEDDFAETVEVPADDPRHEAAALVFGGGWPRGHQNKAQLLASYVLASHRLARIHGAPHVWSRGRWIFDSDDTLLSNLVADTLHDDVVWLEAMDQAMVAALEGMKKAGVSEEKIKSASVAMTAAFTTYGSGNAQASVVRIIKQRMPVLERDTSMTLNMPSGIYDLRQGQLLPHDPDVGHTQMTTVDASDPSDWEAVMKDIYPDEEVRRYYQNYLGRSLFGVVMKGAMNVIGATNSAKSTVLIGVLQAIGYTEEGGYGVSTSDEIFTSEWGLAPVPGARLIAVEEPDCAELTRSQLKRLDQNRLYVHEKFKAGRLVSPSWVQVYLSNEPINIRGVDDASLKRIRVISSETQFVDFPMYEGQLRRDPEVLERIRRGELAESTMAWLLEGAARVVSEGETQALTPPRAAMDATAEVHAQMNDYFDFVETYMCRAEEGEFLDLDDMHERLVHWAGTDAGVRLPPKKFRFGRVREACMSVFGVAPRRTKHGGNNVYANIRMRASSEL